MSGGSWDYFFGRVHEVAEALKGDYQTDRYRKLEDLTPEQREARHRLGDLLVKVAHALHEIEWVDSGDCTTPVDVLAINAVFDENRARSEMVVDLVQQVRHALVSRRWTTRKGGGIDMLEDVLAAFGAKP